MSEVDKDSSGPLKDRVRPVSGHLFLMDGRFEVSPGIGISLRDAFWQKVGFGAAFTYHLTESVGLSARASYNLSLISGAAQICDPVGGGCAAPTEAELSTFNGKPANVSFGRMSFLSSVDLQWAPLYGKLALFSEKVLNFNMVALDRQHSRTLDDRHIIAREIILGQQFANFHFNQLEQLFVVNHVALVQEHDDVRYTHLASQQDVLTRLRHRAVSGTYQNCAVHLRSTRDHVLYIVSVALGSLGLSSERASRPGRRRFRISAPRWRRILSSTKPFTLSPNGPDTPSKRCGSSIFK